MNDGRPQQTRAAPPASATQAPAARLGGRCEQLIMLATLITDLISIPFHLIVFLVTARRRRRQLLQDLQESRS